MHKLHLDDPQHWEWRQSPCKALTPPAEVFTANLENGWTQCSQMKRGSMIQVELQAAGKIPDAFLGRNEEVSSYSSRPSLPSLTFCSPTACAMGWRGGLAVSYLLRPGQATRERTDLGSGLRRAGHLRDRLL